MVTLRVLPLWATELTIGRCTRRDRLLLLLRLRLLVTARSVAVIVVRYNDRPIREGEKLAEIIRRRLPEAWSKRSVEKLPWGAVRVHRQGIG